MPAVYSIRFLPAGRVLEFYGNRGPHYELEEGHFLRVHTVPVWCRRCGKITLGERLPSLEEIDERLKEIANPQWGYLKTLFPSFPESAPGQAKAFIEEDLADCQRERRWREMRSSPPKCVQCGSTDIVGFPLCQPVPHPAGPGTIYVQIDGMADTISDDIGLLTPEGDRIPHRRMPDPNPPRELLKRVREFDRRFYIALGKENAGRKCGHEGCSRGAVQKGEFCKVHQFESVMQKSCPFND